MYCFKCRDMYEERKNNKTGKLRGRGRSFYMKECNSVKIHWLISEIINGNVIFQKLSYYGRKMPWTRVSNFSVTLNAWILESPSAAPVLMAMDQLSRWFVVLPFWHESSDVTCLHWGMGLRQGFSLALEPVLKLALVDQAVLELTKIHLPLPPKCWD